MRVWHWVWRCVIATCKTRTSVTFNEKRTRNFPQFAPSYLISSATYYSHRWVPITCKTKLIVFLIIIEHDFHAIKFSRGTIVMNLYIWTPNIDLVSHCEARISNKIINFLCSDTWMKKAKKSMFHESMKNVMTTVRFLIAHLRFA